MSILVSDAEGVLTSEPRLELVETDSDVVKDDHSTVTVILVNVEKPAKVGVPAKGSSPKSLSNATIPPKQQTSRPTNPLSNQ